MKDNKKTPFIVDEESQQIIDYFYNVIPTEMILPDGKIIEVSDEGSISLLALGFKGIIAWRKKREQVYGSRIYSPFLEAFNERQKENENKQNK